MFVISLMVGFAAVADERERMHCAGLDAGQANAERLRRGGSVVARMMMMG